MKKLLKSRGLWLTISGVSTFITLVFLALSVKTLVVDNPVSFTALFVGLLLNTFSLGVNLALHLFEQKSKQIVKELLGLIPEENAATLDEVIEEERKGTTNV